MDLEITKPFHIGMDIVECEMERLPSIKIASTIEFFHPTGKLEYSVNDLWFECLEWDKFVDSLRKLTLTSDNLRASLSSMSNEFCLVISLSEDRRKCTTVLDLKEKDTDSGELSTCIQSSLELDEIDSLADKFADLSFL